MNLRGGEPELNLVCYLAARDKVAIDVGANWGSYTGVMLRHCRNVFAFEANPRQAAQLKRNWPAAEVMAIGLSDRSEDVILHIPRDGHGRAYTGHASMVGAHVLQQFADVEPVLVKVTSLDTLGLPPCGFIKIDVEGFEMRVLAGAAATIKRDKPNLLIESVSSHAPDCPQAVVNMLEQWGYSAWYFHNRRLHPFCEWTPEQTADYGGPIYNFIFVHEGNKSAQEIFPAYLLA